MFRTEKFIVAVCFEFAQPILSSRVMLMAWLPTWLLLGVKEMRPELEMLKRYPVRFTDEKVKVVPGSASDPFSWQVYAVPCVALLEQLRLRKGW